MGQWFSRSEKKTSTSQQQRNFSPGVARNQYEPSTSRQYNSSYRVESVARHQYEPSLYPYYQETTNYNVSRSNSIRSGYHANQSTIGERTSGYRPALDSTITDRPISRQSTLPQRYRNPTSVSSVGNVRYENKPISGYAPNSSTRSNVGYTPRTRQAKTIILYHYTTNQNANTIRRAKLVMSSTMSTPFKYRQHGLGVYFTSLDPSVDPTRLALNNFTNGGTHVTNGLYRKVHSVVEITFYENEVEKINCRNRDIYLFKGSIDLRNYEGRYRIYTNPNL